MLMSVTGAWAQMTFVKDVKVSARSTDGGYNDLISEGYTVAKKSDGTAYFDFNGGGTHGDYVYIGYKTTTNPQEAIADLAIVYNGYGINPDFGTDDFLYDGSEIMTIGSKRYYLAPHSGSADMNNGNTKHIYSVYLYYTRDINTTEGTKLLTEIGGLSLRNQTPAVPEGWDSMPHGYMGYLRHQTGEGKYYYEMLPDKESECADTNKGGGGYDSYITCKYADVQYYVDIDGQVKLPGIVTPITNESSFLDSGWYIVQGNVQTGKLTCRGDVKIILADGAKLTAQGTENNAGISVSSDDQSLTIYGQINQTGQLIAEGGDNAAGIGGDRYRNNRKITIAGGLITAKGGSNACGIGGGELGDPKNIFVTSSLVLCADGNNPPTTFISHTSDMDVSASLKGKQYAIVRQPVRNITVTLDKQDGTGSTEQIMVNEGSDMPVLTALPTYDRYTFCGYFANPNGIGTKYYNDDGTSAHQWDRTEGATIYAYWEGPENYVDADGKIKTVSTCTTITNASSTTTLNSGWYIVRGADVRTKTLVCEGDVHIILADGAKLTATADSHDAAIRVSADGASLTVYGQENQTGQLIADGTNFAAGIGGGEYGKGHNITINGGVITATSKHMGAGIGGGENGKGENITINGGVITATGGFDAAGIGGGARSSGENITINGGVIRATGGTNGSGIGGGFNGGASNIHINAALIVKADSNEQPTTEIEHTSTEDMASKLNGTQYATLALPSVAMNHVEERDANFGTFYHKYAAYTVPNEDRRGRESDSLLTLGI